MQGQTEYYLVIATFTMSTVPFLGNFVHLLLKNYTKSKSKYMLLKDPEIKGWMLRRHQKDSEQDIRLLKVYGLTNAQDLSLPKVSDI